MTAQAQGPELVRFPCAPWKIAGQEDDRIQPIPGTWTLAPESLCQQDIKGIICCPNRACRRAALVRYDMGRVDNGTLLLDGFQCAGCKALYNAQLLEWDTRRLFCAVYDIILPDGARVQKKEYLHAEHRAQALMFFSSGTGYELDRVKQKWQMVDCGLAIGYFGQESDKDQINLSAD